MLAHQSSSLRPASPALMSNRLDDHIGPAGLRSIAHIKRFRREQDIYSQGDRNDTWYRVLAGAARKYLMRADGRRHIVDIHLPGDFFGFSSRNCHRFGVQAVADRTVIVYYPRQRFEAALDEDPELAREIRTECFDAIDRLQEQALVIGTMTAQEKVLAFLTYFCDRLSAAYDSGGELPISRYDIADLLGISAETVCRAFTELQRRGALSLDGPRRISLRRRSRHYE